MNYSLVPESAGKVPFQKGAEYYCKQCGTYSVNFCKSHIRKHIKLCRLCAAENLKRSRLQQTQTERLRHQLYKQLAAQGRMDVARGISLDAIDEILRENGVNDPSAVQRIVAPRNGSRADLTDAKKYRIDYKP